MTLNNLGMVEMILDGGQKKDDGKWWMNGTKCCGQQQCRLWKTLVPRLRRMSYECRTEGNELRRMID